MKKLVLLGGAALLAVSGNALSQTTSTEPAPDAATAAPALAPAEATPPDAEKSAPAAPAATEGASAVAQSTAPAADAAASTPPASADAAAAPIPTTPANTAPASADASAKLSADWAKYDVGNKGKLTPLEFGSWVLAKNGQDVTAQVEKTKTSKRANLPAIKVLNATSAEFAKADKDKDRMISPDELAGYLSA